MGKNVLYVVPATGVGGAETFLYHTGLFHTAGYRPVYACLRPGPLVDQLRALGHPAPVAPRAPRLRNLASILSCVRWLSGLIHEHDAQLVHSTLAYGALFGSLAARHSGVPHVWFQHGPVGSWQDWVAGHLPAEAIFVNSTYTGDRQGALSASRHFERVFPGVITPEEVNRESARARLTAALGESFVTAMLCRPQSQKGIELWIDAAAKARDTGTPVACALLGGQPRGDYGDALAARARRARVPWLHLPYDLNPWRTLAGADALVCASISPEGFGLSLAEALAHGVPAVAPREGGPLDFLREGETGHFFEPRNATDLARALAQLARDPHAGVATAARGRAFAERHLAAPASVRALENAYGRALEPT